MKTEVFEIKRKTVLVLWLVAILLSCKEKKAEDPTPEPPPAPETSVITIDPADVKQEMVGFGGALTWYSNWVTNNNKLEEIADLMFTDLGIDIVRFKTWYYPDGYPTNKGIDNMPDDNAKPHWDATNRLYELAMERNPNIKILLSSWGPPKEMKSNGQLPMGTLKKDDSGFMYDEFAEYWYDILEHLPFNPDYISIQNEPTYLNAGWTTCQWAATETATLPGYDIAFDKVYDKIKDRLHVPVMIGPESQDVPTFAPFANILKDKPHCGLLAYHPYNINSGTSANAITSSLQSIGSFNTKPNMMTEFSGNLNWYNTALFIHRSLVNANTSAYIYWTLAWSTPSSGEDSGMISIASFNSTAAYTVTPFYYLMKHFSKHVDAGYHRVGAVSSRSSLFTTAFINPANNKLTVVVINDGSQTGVTFQVNGKMISNMSADQSSEGNYYKSVEISSPTQSITLPGKSITTVVLDI